MSTSGYRFCLSLSLTWMTTLKAANFDLAAGETRRWNMNRTSFKSLSGQHLSAASTPANARNLRTAAATSANQPSRSLRLSFQNWKTLSAAVLLCAAAQVASANDPTGPTRTLLPPPFQTMADFDGTNGANPGYMNLVQGLDGNFYGTTYGGGAHGDGTVFQLTPAGTLTTIYSFCSDKVKSTCEDGSNPNGGLVLTTDGIFYGTTYSGGKNGDGTFFSITTEGALTTLYNFNQTHGTNPIGTLVQGSDGNFYGTTFIGGANDQGTVYKITPAGAHTTLHSFAVSDGAGPYSGLVEGTDGDFYGTTWGGGAPALVGEDEWFPGVVFKITSSGKFTVLHYFDFSDGGDPSGQLVLGTDGNFYGTTQGGFPGGGLDSGSVFKITPAGKLTTVYSGFCYWAKCYNGSFPIAGLVQASDGNFYGTTVYNAKDGYGAIFQVTPKGKMTVLHNFDKTDGNLPYGALIQSPNGALYGSTNQGGTGNLGAIFILNEQLPKTITAVPAAGTPETSVILQGSGFTSATGVSFNGTAATFTILSDTEIQTTVPAGATSGRVSVEFGGASSSSLTTNGQFIVPAS